MAKCLIVVPIYKEALSLNEEANLRYSLSNLNGFETAYVAPETLIVDAYPIDIGIRNIARFPDEFFKSPRHYSLLLLSEAFYKSFTGFEYLLVLQPDAVILKPELESWLGCDYDYIGAPWPGGFELDDLQQYIPNRPGFLAKTFVGNGGLSLRRIDKIVSLLATFPAARDQWLSKGNPEDLFISFVSNFIANFRVPNVRTAAEFSHEVNPRLLNGLIENKLPFGVHAWEKYDPEFWLTRNDWPLELRKISND